MLTINVLRSFFNVYRESFALFRYNSKAEQLEAKNKYQSHFNASQLTQIENPEIIDERTVFFRRNDDKYVCHSKDQPKDRYSSCTREGKFSKKAISYKCENCRRLVTEGVINYSAKKFDGHIFCIDCQNEPRPSNLHGPRAGKGKMYMLTDNGLSDL